MKKKSSAPLAIILALLLIVAGAGYYFSPLLALYNLKNAAIAGNRDKVADSVDFPAVREDVKSQMMASLQTEMAKEKDNPFAAMGVAMGAAMVDKLVNAFVNADTISNVMKSGDLKIGQQKQAPPSPGAESEPKNDVKIDVQWTSIDSVNVVVSEKNDPNKKPVSLRMKKNGLIGWKLVGIKLPIDEAQQAPAN